MDAIADALIGFISEQNNLAGLLVIAAAALIEYILPPFPGDTVTLFGSVLITAYDWSFWGVFGAVMVGSVAGSMAAFYAGRRWRARRARSSRRHPSLDRLVAKFHRHGAAYLIINRFLPGIRSLFFVAAGLAEMKPRAVVAYSALSAALWNLGLIAIGSALGANFDTLLAWVRKYTLAAWILIAAVIVLWVARWIWSRWREERRLARRGRRPRGGGGDERTPSPDDSAETET
ncbi:DedA family protein [Haliangium sp.]|uniref:DedA family protein n=1 Tax=Haliangium sp. TaxID=2663208 RepID=UPI003D0A0871